MEKLRIVFFQEQQEDGTNPWIAQCVELNLNASGKTLADAQREFVWTFLGQVAINRERGRAPLAGVRAAPEKIRRQFDASFLHTDKVDVSLAKALEKGLTEAGEHRTIEVGVAA